MAIVVDYAFGNLKFENSAVGNIDNFFAQKEIIFHEGHAEEFKSNFFGQWDGLCWD